MTSALHSKCSFGQQCVRLVLGDICVILVLGCSLFLYQTANKEVQPSTLLYIFFCVLNVTFDRVSFIIIYRTDLAKEKVIIQAFCMIENSKITTHSPYD